MIELKSNVVELIQEQHPTKKGVILIKGKYEDGTYAERVLSIVTTSNEEIEQYKAIIIDEETSYDKARKKMFKQPIKDNSGRSLEELMRAL